MAFNGLDGASGDYLLPPMTAAQVSALAQGQSFYDQEISELRQKAFDLHNPNAGVEADARNLAETGWGVIFASDADPAVRDALQPLLNLRREQAGDLFKEFSRAKGFRPEDSKDDFLSRHGMGPGPVNPSKVPYYLLIVGDPETIPYRFQYQLDIQYAVGRICFSHPHEYAQYAQSVLTAETGFALPAAATFFGVSNPDDRATQMSSEYLVAPLAQRIREALPKWQAGMQKTSSQAPGQTPLPSWEFQTIFKEQATRQQLSDLLNGAQAPALLFSASHGIGFPNGDPRQILHQGALVCQDWPGPRSWQGPIPEDFYFASDHLSSDANLLGMLAFFFACYGAGTPQQDEFARQIWGSQTERRLIAPHSFIASLPMRMLALPKGGALAAIGHIERAWGNSFFWGEAGPQLQVFHDCLERLIRGGYPVGYAMEVFNNRYAELSSDLSSEIQEINDYGKRPNDLKLAGLWTANNDARNYIILGDPAVRLAVGRNTSPAFSRPVLLSLAPSAAPEKDEQTGTDAMENVSAQSIPSADAVSPNQDYGLMDSLNEIQANLGASLPQFVSKLSAILSHALDDITSLEVATYVSDDIAQVKYENGQFTGAQLRAVTRIRLDGDTQVCLPVGNSELDAALWKTHLDSMQQAQINRMELLKIAVSAASGLANLIKPKEPSLTLPCREGE